jgi:hypothetical protein
MTIYNIEYIHLKIKPYVIMAWLVLRLNNCDLTKVDSYRVFMANQSSNMDHVPALFPITHS